MASEETPDYGTNGTIARDLGEQYRGLLKTEEITVGTGTRENPTVLVVAQGREVVSIKKYLDEYLEKPERRKGTAQAFDIESFKKLVTRFEGDESVVFADPGKGENPSFTAVYDYHPSGTVATKADWLEHRAVFRPRLSDEWNAWKAKNGTFMNQVEFAQFIEDRIGDIIVPRLDEPKIATYADLVQGKWAEPTDLVGLSRGLEVNVGMSVKNAVRLSSGEIQMTYNEQHSDGTGQPIRVPNLFQIHIPVFYGGDYVTIAAHLRYRAPSGGALLWGYQLVRPDIVFTDAFETMVKDIEADVNSDVFLGAPEGSTIILPK